MFTMNEQRRRLGLASLIPRGGLFPLLPARRLLNKHHARDEATIDILNYPLFVGSRAPRPDNTGGANRAVPACEQTLGPQRRRDWREVVPRRTLPDYGTDSLTVVEPRNATRLGTYVEAEKFKRGAIRLLLVNI
ncbi:hypothetical protein F4775DRAFT_388532 [Biscogniauxia sp. FL1348]|nr:hypothetical protein F4775DRAFT_388532 [Biscogniauxia sp. FL1348]